VVVLACAAALALALAGWGTLEPREAPRPAHPTLLDGDGWVTLSLREREALVQGFLLGAAAEQAVAGPGGPDAGTGTGPGGAATAPLAAEQVAAAIAELRGAGALRFSLAPSMLARRLDEYYWWRNRRGVPVAAALVEIQHRLRTDHY
jgi:hypothetical protein